MNAAGDIEAIKNRIALYDDEKAYEALCRFMYNPLHKTAFAFVKSNEIAEEIVSDVLVKVWQIRSRLIAIDNLRVYMYTVTKNYCLKYIARNSRNPVTSLDLISFETSIDFVTPEAICISLDIIKHIQLAIDALPPKCRLIFLMVKQDGLRYKEVAAILCISELTVRNQLAIALKKMAQALPTNAYSI